MGFRSRIAKALRLPSCKNTPIKASRDGVLPGGNGVALETLQHTSSECDRTLLDLFRTFTQDVHSFVHRAHPEDESLRSQVRAEIYAHFIRFLRDEQKPARECK